MKPRNVILVTGAPRSGTTPAGERLCSAANAIELYEPMNPGVGDKAVGHWFEVPGSGAFSNADAIDLLERIATAKLRLRTPALGSGRHPILNRTRRSAFRALMPVPTKALIWKDPFAFFLAPLIATRTTIPVIVTVRDPLGVVGSFKRMEWYAPALDVARRMQEAGYAIPIDVLSRAQSATSPAKQAALLWFLLQSCLLEWLRNGVPLNAFLSQSLLEEPQAADRLLRAITGLELGALPSTSSKPRTAGTALPRRAHIKDRSPLSVTSYWKQVLSVDEISYCNDLNGELWSYLQELLPALSSGAKKQWLEIG